MNLDELFNAPPRSERIDLLESLAQDLSQESNLRVNFICTHNSRRSHFCEILFRSAALHFGLKNVRTYSGGTEGTALFPEVAASFERHGFTAVSEDAEGQLAWKIFHSDLEKLEESPLLFSKAYTHKVNPQENYHAVMVCDSANEACPIVFGATKRHPVLFVDPKRSDGTPEQSRVYDATLQDIASEMGFVARRIALNRVIA